MDDKKSDQLREFLLQIKALLESMETNLRADSESVWKYAGYKQYMRKYNQIVNAIIKIMPINAVVDLYDIDKVPGIGNTMAIQQKEYFESIHANLSILKAYLESKLNLKTDEIFNLRNFLQANLRRAIFRTPEKEMEIQDAIEQLFIGRGMAKGIDYDREIGRVKVSLKEVVPDFILPKLDLALEVKLSKDKGKSKAIVDEINADIMAYGKKYSSIFFVVYDLGSIRDEIEFKRDLEAADRVEIIIVKH